MGNAGICRVFGASGGIRVLSNYVHCPTDAILLNPCRAFLNSFAAITSFFNAELLNRIDNIKRL